MKNRLMHLLKDWDELERLGAPSAPVPKPRSYPPPNSVNMTMPVEMLVSRELLLILVGASVMEIDARRRDAADVGATQDVMELEAALQQQLSFRAWAQNHPGRFIPVALYPAGTPRKIEDPDSDLEAGWGPQ